MGAISGTIYAVFGTVGTVATATGATDRLYAMKDATLNVNVAIEETTNKESGGWWAGIPGTKDWSIDFSGTWDEAGSATTMTTAEIMANIIAGAAAMKFSFIPAALGTTIPGWMGLGCFNGCKITSPVDKPCETSGSVKGVGPLSLFTA